MRKHSKFVGFSADTRQVKDFIKGISGSKEGRKVTRAAARAALEIFNVETGDNAGKLNLKSSGKGWRKLLKKKSSYLYKISARNDGSFKAVTGINYKKAVLRVSHLVERGFQHSKAGKVTGTWYRFKAYEDNQQKVMQMFMRNLKWGWTQTAKTGKAPSASQIRKNFK